jgi:hypothetical protein
MNVEVLTEDQAVRGLDYPIEIKVYAAGVQIKPSSATITVQGNDGSVWVNAAASTVNSSTGTITYTLDEDYTGTLAENCIIQIVYIVSSVSYQGTFLFDVVIQPLRLNVIDADLTAYEPRLADGKWSSQTNFDAQIQEAFRVIKRDIKNKGKRPVLIIDGAQVRELIILKTFEIIFLSWIKATGDIFQVKQEKYYEKYGLALEAIILKYDENESGTIEAKYEDQEAFGQPMLRR